MNQTIQLWKAKKTKGVFIPRTLYDQLTEFIIESVKNMDGVTLVELIEKANEKIFTGFSGNHLYWLINVKQDMEVMGLINVQKFPDCTQFITLKKTRKNNIHLKLSQRSVNSDSLLHVHLR